MTATLTAAIGDFSQGPDDVPVCGRRHFINGHRQVNLGKLNLYTNLCIFWKNTRPV